VKVGGVDGELRPWHYIYVYNIESRLIKRESDTAVMYEKGGTSHEREDHVDVGGPAFGEWHALAAFGARGIPHVPVHVHLTKGLRFH